MIILLTNFLLHVQYIQSKLCNKVLLIKKNHFNALKKTFLGKTIITIRENNINTLELRNNSDPLILKFTQGILKNMDHDSQHILTEDVFKRRGLPIILYRNKVSHGIFNLTFRMLQHTSSEVTVTKYDEI